MPKLLIELKSMNLERGHGVTAKEIATYIGEDSDFDEKVTKVSTKRFKEIISAYKKKIFADVKSELRKEMVELKDKTFIDEDDHHIALVSMYSILIEALQYGSFRIPGEKSCQEKAQKAKIDLLLCLIEMGSPHYDALSTISFELDTEVMTLNEFIDNKKDIVRMKFSSSRKMEHSVDRFNRIFSQIKKSVKLFHEAFRTVNKKRARLGYDMMSKKQQIEYVLESKNEIIEDHKERIQYHELGQKIIDIRLKEIEFLIEMNRYHNR